MPEQNKVGFPASSDFVDFVAPLGDRLNFYNPANLPTDQPKNDAAGITKAIPQAFIDAMIVREAVYVREQGVPLQNEFDDDDPRSFHWIAYASVPASGRSLDEATTGDDRRQSTSTKIPIGTIRIVPPPHPPHHRESDMHTKQEEYVKLGRLAVLPEYRKIGISGLLINTALRFVKDHPNDVVPNKNPSWKEAMKADGQGSEFDGLVLVHAQSGLQKFWQKYGFVRDDSMGEWDEEGIDHIGMWKKLDLTAGRKKPKVLTNVVEYPGSPWASLR